MGLIGRYCHGVWPIISGSWVQTPASPGNLGHLVATAIQKN